jgi:hypothetical protein
MRTRYLALNLLNLFTGLVETFLALRFVFKLLGANPSNGFVGWIYDMSGVLLEPFRGIFSAAVLENKYIFDFTTLFAMVIYALLALLIAALINLIAPPPAITDADDEAPVRRRWFRW